MPRSATHEQTVDPGNVVTCAGAANSCFLEVTGSCATPLQLWSGLSGRHSIAQECRLSALSTE